MGGLGPGIGGGEWLVLGVVALLVVGPERLPGMLREMGKWVAKARGMANEFRASFDDMARQSELDDLRREVEALRSGSPVKLGADADAAFKDIKAEFDKPLFDATAPTAEPTVEPAMTPSPSEWPVDTGAVVDTQAPKPAEVSSAPKTRRAAKAKSKVATKAASNASTTAASKAARPKTATPKAKPARPRVSRAKAADL
ncbi:Sec-independent protein translocase protein TatB [Brevundimonas sp. VNH65]|uniref:Sec-independent protein translocase protein TatB n=1 Tax=Brevundimonas sp. VNH65 TaxID=3400917 RepID=UPI003C0BF7A7